MSCSYVEISHADVVATKAGQVIGPILTLVSFGLVTCEVRIRNVGVKRQVKVPTSKNWDFQSDTPPTKSLNF